MIINLLLANEFKKLWKLLFDTPEPTPPQCFPNMLDNELEEFNWKLMTRWANIDQPKIHDF